MLLVVSAAWLLVSQPGLLRPAEDIDTAPPAHTQIKHSKKAVTPKHKLVAAKKKAANAHAKAKLTTHSTAKQSVQAPPVKPSPVKLALDAAKPAPTLHEISPPVAPLTEHERKLEAAMNGQQPPPPAATADTSEIPPGAPDDDYGLVAWCQGALTGHMSLYKLVKPQLDEMERKGEDKDNARIDEQQQQAGREYLTLYAHARQVADQRSSGSQKARGDAARADGEHIWAAARLADPSTRMWSWIMWELPARCETAARRLELNRGVMGEVVRGHNSDDGPEHRPN